MESSNLAREAEPRRAGRGQAEAWARHSRVAIFIGLEKVAPIDGSEGLEDLRCDGSR